MIKYFEKFKTSLKYKQADSISSNLFIISSNSKIKAEDLK